MPKVEAEISPIHIENSRIARQLYIDGRSAENGRIAWRAELRLVRTLIAGCLRSSDYLCDIEAALRDNAGNMNVLRQLTAPPMSQDQFALLCPEWAKAAERSGRPASERAARAGAEVVGRWLDAALAPWLYSGRVPTRPELRRLFWRAGALMAAQRSQTSLRREANIAQEGAIMDLLRLKGWTELPSRLIDTRAAVPPRHFMHKTRFATKTTAAQEVDIACGLLGTYVLAMECKVTNDETNSVKRINDVLKKAAAWKEHWGSFVHTAALLQGVIAPKDVQRLEDAGVLIFWSHDLTEFSNWLDHQGEA